MRTRLFISLFLAVLLISCSGNSSLKPKINGKSGEIVVVMEKEVWNGECGEKLRDILEQEFPFLPQPEPSFTLINVPPSAFSQIFQSHRNIMIFSTQPNEKQGLTIVKDKWASPQTIMYIFGKSNEDLTKYIVADSAKIMDVFEHAERMRIVQSTKALQELGVKKEVSDIFGGSPCFPKGYVLRKKTSDFAWIEYSTNYLTQCVFEYSYPYTDSTMLQLDSLIAIRNRVLKKYVPGPTDGSYMITDIEITPSMKWLSIKGRKFVELRGLWKVQNDFMAGPFVCHVFYDQSNSKLIYLDAFVYAPKYDKRNYLRQVESVLYTFEWVNDKE